MICIDESSVQISTVRLLCSIKLFHKEKTNRQKNLNYFLWVPHILLLMELAGFIFNSLYYWLALRLGAMIAV